jgi:hypothetical protein
LGTGSRTFIALYSAICEAEGFAGGMGLVATARPANIINMAIIDIS